MEEILQQYVDECAKLPVDLKKNFDLIRQIDIDVERKAELIQQKVIALTKSHRGLSKDAQQSLHKEIQKLFDEILSMSEKKLKLATVTYNVVDDQIVRLDRDSERANAVVKRKPEPVVPEDLTQKKKRKQSRKRGKSQTDIETEASKLIPVTDVLTGSSSSNGFGKGGGVPGLDLPIDPNEPVYCTCRQVSYGNMVMCDNKDCPIEWFHFGCVGLTETPKGRWYCSTCLVEKAKKKNPTAAKNEG